VVREAEADLLRLAYQWVIVYPGVGLGPVEATKPHPIDIELADDYPGAA
jgi:hypothetical protein